MTNGEKYLKEEKYIFDIAKGIAEAICYDDMEHAKEIIEKEIADWFTSNTKPTLTEDERVILRNIDTKYKYIGRNGKPSHIYLNDFQYYSDIKGYYPAPFFNHLFQFIKERRRI